MVMSVAVASCEPGMPKICASSAAPGTTPRSQLPGVFQFPPSLAPPVQVMVWADSVPENEIKAQVNNGILNATELPSIVKCTRKA